MDAERLLAELSRVLTRRGQAVRTEPLSGLHPGAACLIKGQRVVLLNSRVPHVERLFVLADCLAEGSLEGLELSAEARKLVLRRVARSSNVVGARAVGPGVAKATAGSKRQRHV